MSRSLKFQQLWKQAIPAKLSNIARSWVIQWKQKESADYRTWRNQFLGDRLRFALWITAACFLTFVIQGYSQLFFKPDKVRADFTEAMGSADLFEPLLRMSITADIVRAVLLLGCLILVRTAWGRRRSVLMFLYFSWTISLAPQIVGTAMGIPNPVLNDWILIFFAQAILMPVHWGLHLFSQLVPLFYYITVNLSLGTTSIGDQPIFDEYASIFIFWACVIADISVFTYERLKRSEFESRRELKLFLHAVTHDLRAPVTGTSIVLQSLLKKPEEKITVDRADLEWLLRGCDRQNALINSLLEAHASEFGSMPLNLEPIRLNEFMQSVLSELQPSLERNRVNVINHIREDLPEIDGDRHQLWRVFCNIITNSLKHNPNGIELTLDAALTTQKLTRPKSFTSLFNAKLKPNHSKQKQWIYCSIRDNGVGIERKQQKRLFDLYTRGAQARYMPGLGLGLYLCKQIVSAHGGEIGVISQLGGGATFWLTLPVAQNTPR
ncbi:HAMP domain-containing histidine kinase [Phormidium tenue FACHB-886]|nr:HAMP domain-containing histidine kinase [Phormidium tenue FACHB-886]